MSSTYIVTGASSGIGKQVCLDLAKSSHQVLAVGRDQTRTLETLNECRRLSQAAHQMYVFDFVQDDLTKLAEQLPTVDGIVHCAGVLKIIPVRNLSRKSLVDILQVNTFAPTMLTTEMLKNNKIRHGGSVVFVSSTAATNVDKGMLAYSMSKAALDTATLGFAKEFSGSHKIRFNSVRSGYVNTPMVEKFGQLVGPDKLKEIESQRIPLGFASPTEVSQFIQFLLSPQSAHITGSCLKIDGGETCTLF